jgi:hypothetical protein
VDKKKVDLLDHELVKVILDQRVHLSIARQATVEVVAQSEHDVLIDQHTKFHEN